MTRMSGLCSLDLFQDFRPVTIGQGIIQGHHFGILTDRAAKKSRERFESFDFVFRVDEKGNAGAWKPYQTSSSTMEYFKGLMVFSYLRLY